MRKKSSIAVFAGGFSGEFEVSLRSAQTIMDHLNKELFEAWMVEVTRSGWIVRTEDGAKDLDRNTFTFRTDDGTVRFDYAYIIIHGAPGEDGKLQGYLDMMGIPYSTGSVLNMSLTFNKARTQRLMIQESIPVAEHVIFNATDIPDSDHVINTVGLPCFVKPSESGSSIGVSKVSDRTELQAAIAEALSIHHEVIIESMVHGRELACGVLRVKGKTIVLPVTEITSERDFFDYKAKYEDSATQEVTPAPIASEAYALCQELSKRVYELTDCKGIARADFFLTGDELVFIEINTIPGMSKESIVPKQLHHAGLELRTILTDIIQEDLKI